MSKVDLDYVMSKNTLSYIENSLLDYKKRILEDLSKFIETPLKDLETEFLKSEKKIRYHGKDRSDIDCQLCMARVWHSRLGPVQCSRKPYGEDVEFCKIHLDKQNYGRIDLPFENLNN